jgi:Skp family chaperone for outer membrane proteins
MNEINFSIYEEDIELFVAVLALGILNSIKSKDLLHEIGIWSLARPVFLKNLKNKKMVSQKLINIIEQFDELNLHNELDAKACSDDIDDMIHELREIISNVDEDSLRINLK